MATKMQFDEADPYPVYAQLRGMAPVLRMDWAGLGRIWVVTRHREGLAVLKDPGFVRNVNPTAASGRTLPVRGFGRDMSELDPPDHTRLRRLVTKAFTPRMVQRFEARIAQLADQILDPAMSRGGIELISEYASVIPLTIITELLGVPVGDIGKFRGFIYSLTLSQMFRRTNAELDSAKSRFTTHLHGVFAARRQAPRDDLVSALVQVEQEGDRLSPDELIGMVYLLLVGGFEDMVNLIGNGILTLLRHPEQLEMLRQNPALADTAVDELLRFESPLKFSVFCCPTTDVDLGGVRIPRGAQIRVLIPSANRDGAQFAAPDALDITRDPCPHLSFGQGIHYCLGAPLARLEGRIAVSRLIERAPNLRLADPARMIWNKHPILRGLQQLPLRF